MPKDFFPCTRGSSNSVLGKRPVLSRRLRELRTAAGLTRYARLIDDPFDYPITIA